MKIYTSFVDTELSKLIESIPPKSRETFVKIMKDKLRHKLNLAKKQLNFLNQYS